VAINMANKSTSTSSSASTEQKIAPIFDLETRRKRTFTLVDKAKQPPRKRGKKAKNRTAEDPVDLDTRLSDDAATEPESELEIRVQPKDCWEWRYNGVVYWKATEKVKKYKALTL
jgi:hypothetical protein